MKRHAVINKDTNVVKTVIIYDGVSPWAIPDNHYLLEHPTIDSGDHYEPNKKKLTKFYDSEGV